LHSRFLGCPRVPCKCPQMQRKNKREKRRSEPRHWRDPCKTYPALVPIHNQSKLRFSGVRAFTESRPPYSDTRRVGWCGGEHVIRNESRSVRSGCQLLQARGLYTLKDRLRGRAVTSATQPRSQLTYYHSAGIASLPAQSISAMQSREFLSIFRRPLRYSVFFAG